MECIVVFTMLVVGVSLAVAFSSMFRPARDPRVDVFEQVRRHFNGHVTATGWGSQPNLVFYYGRVGARVEIGAGGGPWVTTMQIALYWPDRTPRVHVYSHAMYRAAERNIPAYLVHVAPPQFGRHYLITGGEAEEVRALLTEGVRLEIDRLRKFLGNDLVHVFLGERMLLVRKPAYAMSADWLARFIELSLALYDQVVLSRTVGIHFVEGASTEPLPDPLCPICGEAIDGIRVTCRSCRTPHHAECWQYNGACSTYGCRDTAYVAAPLVSVPAAQASGERRLSHRRRRAR